MTAIQIAGLNKTFNRTNRALIDIDLTIESGEMVALIGASGSGKSTLIRHIAGLVAVTEVSLSWWIVWMWLAGIEESNQWQQ